MDASCGPSNALSQLSKHTQRDTSLQHERAHQQVLGGPGSFRNRPVVDANLNQEFHQFSNNGPREFVTPAGLHTQQLAPSMQPSHQMHSPAPPQQWVHDFNGLSIHGEAVHTRARAGSQRSGWHEQFMQNMQLQQQQQTNTQQTGSPRHQGIYSSSMAGQVHQSQSLGRQQLYSDHLQGQQPQQPEQEQLHYEPDAIEIENSTFESHFDQIERELAQKAEQEVQQTEISNELEKQQFADAARQVRKSMTTANSQKSEETASKFQQSDFLKLMSSISEREVELSAEGDKLVSKSTGEDVREYLSDPLRHERTHEPDYHRPVHESQEFEEGMMATGPGLRTHGAGSLPQRTRESENVRSHLPDPLAHIKDGALAEDLTPLQAARIISGGQVQGDSWMEDESWDNTPGPGRMPSLLSHAEQEIYDDYRHDDH